jgi:hypothetical protein
MPSSCTLRKSVAGSRLQAHQSSASIRKKKEQVGNFKNPGRIWCQQADPVLVHDWPQDALGQAIPYGIYDTTRNHGYVAIGDCFDTPRFAVEAVSDWWWQEGQRAFPDAQHLLVLADAGGSNSCRSRVWKAQIQEQLCDAFGLEVTVCHYPTGCSKWNPIEHRLFSFISINWAGVPLRSFDLTQRLIAGTTTTTGLTVTACLKRGGNEQGEAVSDADMQRLLLTRHAVCPQWNYTLSPRADAKQTAK